MFLGSVINAILWNMLFIPQIIVGQISLIPGDTPPSGTPPDVNARQARKINISYSTISQNTNREKITKRDNHNKVGINNGNNSDSKDYFFILMDLRTNLNLKGILIQRLTPEEIILWSLFINM